MSGRRHTVDNHQQLHLVAAADLTPRRVSQVFEVRGDGNQVGLYLQVHLPILVGLHHLTPHTHTHFQYFILSFFSVVTCWIN